MTTDELKDMCDKGVNFINPLQKASIINVMPNGEEIEVFVNSPTYDLEMENVRMQCRLQMLQRK